MVRFFWEGGIFMWVLLALSIVILYLSLKYIMFLFGKHKTEPGREVGINSILFWGIISAAFGFFAQVLGIYMAIGAIMNASDISPMIVMQGFRISFITTISGLSIFICSAIIWFALKYRYQKLLQRN